MNKFEIKSNGIHLNGQPLDTDGVTNLEIKKNAEDKGSTLVTLTLEVDFVGLDTIVEKYVGNNRI